MDQRHHHRGTAPGQTRPHSDLRRRSVHPVLALQRLIGNRGTTRVLARKNGTGTFANSVRIGKLGPIEIKESNIADWIGKKNPETLTVTTAKGKKSSDELKRMSEGKTRVEAIEVTSVSGENTFIKVTFRNAHIKDYAADASGETEQWIVADFDAVNIERISIGKARP
ncbi:MAG: hypothetical protein ABI611_19500 [Solirubrobacteraceae bacterium]